MELEDLKALITASLLAGLVAPTDHEIASAVESSQRIWEAVLEEKRQDKS